MRLPKLLKKLMWRDPFNGDDEESNSLQYSLAIIRSTTITVVVRIQREVTAPQSSKSRISQTVKPVFDSHISGTIGLRCFVSVTKEALTLTSCECTDYS